MYRPYICTFLNEWKPALIPAGHVEIYQTYQTKRLHYYLSRTQDEFKVVDSQITCHNKSLGSKVSSITIFSSNQHSENGVGRALESISSANAR